MNAGVQATPLEARTGAGARERDRVLLTRRLCHVLQTPVNSGPVIRLEKREKVTCVFSYLELLLIDAVFSHWGGVGGKVRDGGGVKGETEEL